MTEDRRSGAERRTGRLGGRRDSDAPDPTELAVAHAITAEMRRRNLTNRNVARRAGLDERTVRRIRECKGMRLGTLQVIADALKLSLATIVRLPK
jgi:DNA-binding Xre family transcriptional regulator